MRNMGGFRTAAIAALVTCILLAGSAEGQRRPRKGLCFLKADPGPCDDDIPRFFYDRWARECKPFRYGGCPGNANNFKTLEECEATCGDGQDCAKLCCDAVNGDYEPPARCLRTCALTTDILCPPNPLPCQPEDCCTTPVRQSCRNWCERRVDADSPNCPKPPRPQECPNVRLCCEPNPPESCSDLCPILRIDCRCSAEDCCSGVIRPGCKGQCAGVGCPNLCRIEDCCTGQLKPGCEGTCAAVSCVTTCRMEDCCNGQLQPGCEGTCAAVSCPRACGVDQCCSGLTPPAHCIDYCSVVDCVPTCGVNECCSGSPPQHCGDQCSAVTCPKVDGCQPFACCSDNMPPDCQSHCSTVDCSLPCCPPIELPGGYACRDCGLRG